MEAIPGAAARFGAAEFAREERCRHARASQAGRIGWGCQHTRLLRPLVDVRAFAVCRLLWVVSVRSGSAAGARDSVRTIFTVLQVGVAVLGRATALQPARGLLCYRLRLAYEHAWETS